MLDSYFKEYFWTFHLLAIGAAGFLVGKTGSAVTASLIAPNPSDLARAKTAGQRGPDRSKGHEGIPLAALLNRNLFHAAREDLAKQEEAEAPAGPTPTFDPEACEPATMAGTALLGTIVGKTPETSVAIFQDPGAERTIVAWVADKILDQATVKSIEQREVRVDHNGRCEVFSLDEQKPGSRESVATMVVAALRTWASPTLQGYGQGPIRSSLPDGLAIGGASDKTPKVLATRCLPPLRPSASARLFALEVAPELPEESVRLKS